MSGIYDATLGIGAAQNFAVLGDKVKVISAPAGVVQIKLDGGETLNLLEGQGYTLEKGRHFRDVAVKNTAGAAQLVNVFIGDSRFEDSRVTGVVSIVDGGKARTVANQAFIAYLSHTAGGAQVPVLQLLNPAGGSTRVVVKAIRVSTPNAGNIAVGLHSVQLPAGPFAPANKRLGGATSVAQSYRDNPAAVPGTTIEAFSVAAGVVVPISLQEPIVLGPGVGLIISHQVAVSTLLAAIEFVEEPNV